VAIVRVKDLLEDFHFKLMAGKDGICREITTSHVSRPGIEITGYFQLYVKERLQLIGRTEMAYLLHLTKEEQRKRLKKLCTNTTPGIIVTWDMEIPDMLLQVANETNVPILQTTSSTTKMISQLANYLESKFAPTTALHGVLVDIYGVGVLITGQSGVGKSEAALELIKRGHRLVADDSVEIRKEDDDRLIGSSPPLIKHFLEIRGLGIIDVMTLFGAGSVIDRKNISLIIHLELWDDYKQYDRLGLDEETMEIMDVHLPRATIPVRPGRNIAVIIEVAAMNFRLKRMGVNAAKDFSTRLTTMIENRQDAFE